MLVRVKLGFTLRFVYIERKQLVEVEVRTLHNDCLVLDVQLHVLELRIREPNFDENGIAVI